MFWNVAGLREIESRAELTLSRAQMYGSINHDSFGVAVPLRRVVAGLALTRLSQPSLDGFDSQGNRTASFTAYDQAVSAGLAWPMGGGISAGTAVKLVNSKIADHSASTVLFDAGIQRRSGRFNMGLSAANVGPGLKFQAEREEAPTTLQASGAMAMSAGFLLSVQGNYALNEEQFRFSLGSEYKLATTSNGGLSFRVGLAGLGADGASPLSLFRGGLGIKLGRMRFDYAFLPSSELGVAHQVSITMQIGSVAGGDQRQ